MIAKADDDFTVEVAVEELRTKVVEALEALGRIEGALAALEATLGVLAASCESAKTPMIGTVTR